MNKPKDKIFREMIQSVGLDQPPGDFTRAIMDEVRADAESKTVADVGLKSLVVKATTGGPSSSFTYHAMKRVRLQGQPVDQPIISRTAWLIAAALIISTLSLLMFLAPGSESVATPILDRAFESLYRFVGELPSAYVLTAVSAGAVLVVDHVLTSALQRRGDSNPRIP